MKTTSKIGIFAFWYRLSLTTRAYSVAVAIGVITILWYWFVYLSFASAIGDLRARLATLQHASKSIATHHQECSSLSGTVKLEHERVEALKNKMKSGASVQAQQKCIFQMADQSAVELGRYDMQKPVDYEWYALQQSTVTLVGALSSHILFLQQLRENRCALIPKELALSLKNEYQHQMVIRFNGITLK